MLENSDLVKRIEKLESEVVRLKGLADFHAGGGIYILGKENDADRIFEYLSSNRIPFEVEALAPLVTFRVPESESALKELQSAGYEIQRISYGEVESYRDKIETESEIPRISMGYENKPELTIRKWDEIED